MLDAKNKQILSVLLQNARLPIQQIAKKVGVSREVAAYRVKRLQEEGYVLGFYTHINEEFLGFSRYVCFVKLKGISENEEKEFIDYLLKHDYVSYLGPIVGKWNISFDVFIKDEKQKTRLVKEIKKRVAMCLEELRIVDVTQEQQTFPQKYLDLRTPASTTTKRNKRITLDATDKLILSTLSTHARVDYQQLATKTSLTANAIKYRMKRMEKAGVIEGYFIGLDLHKLGYQWYNVQLVCHNSHEKHQLKSFFREHPKIVYYYYHGDASPWSIDIGIIAKDSASLRETLMDIRRLFGGVVDVYDIYVLLDELKGNFLPSGVFT